MSFIDEVAEAICNAHRGDIEAWENTPNEVVRTGLTLKEAQEHCNSPFTRGGDWFDGYTKEDH